MNEHVDPGISDEDLLAYNDGAADQELAARIERSEYYRRRAQALAHEQANLSAHLHRHSCPHTLELGEYFLDVLPAAKAEFIATHLPHCPYCAKELLSYKTFLEEDATPPTSLEQMRIVVAHLEDTPGVDTPGGASDWAPGFPPHEEGTVTVYATGANTQIALHRPKDSAQSRANSITGVVMGEMAGQMQVDLWSGETYVATSSVDKSCQFAFEGASPGSYELIFRGSKILIYLPGLAR